MTRVARRAVPAGAAIVALAAVSPGLAGAQGGSRAVSAQDRMWLQSSIAGDRFEIRGGHLAERRGHSQAVRALGARLAADHTKSLHDAVALARRLRIAVPKSPTPTQRQELRAVARFHGRAFDRRYTQLEITDHEQDIAEAQQEIRQGRNAEVRQEARTELPTLRIHLQLATAAHRTA